MAEVAAVIGAVAALLTVVVLALSAYSALEQYKTNSRTQRAEWLTRLFQTFYETSAYLEVRALLEQNEETAFRAAIEEDPDLEQKWTNYCNFFELVAYLHKIGQLSREDVDALFEYWMNGLTGYVGYLDEFGYGNLVEWLRNQGERN